MPQLIQRSPVGLLALLDSKAGGQNPNSFSDEVRGSVELRDYYELRSRFTRNATIAAAAVNGGIGTFVDASLTLAQPAQDEIWHLRSIAFRGATTVGAGAGVQVSLGWRDIRNSSSNLFGTSPLFPNGFAPAWGIQVDAFFSAGMIFGMYVNQAVNSPDLVYCCAFDLYKPV